MVKKINFYKSASKGFTLLEMLIVVTIIGVLAAVVIPRFSVFLLLKQRKIQIVLLCKQLIVNLNFLFH